jgi:2-amino-4-hydroxy-6-hydroxymethyldihydropteridine diphosphokinase
VTAAYVGLGSNVDPEANVHRAVRLLAERARVTALSTFYRTTSIPAGSPDFVNGVVALETGMAPRALHFGLLRAIEATLGRRRTGDPNAPRTIDCDLLVLGDAVVGEADLVLPAREIGERGFVAIPLLEIAPDLVLPGSNEALADVAARLPRGGMWPLVDFTRAMRAELEEVERGYVARRSAGA